LRTGDCDGAIGHGARCVSANRLIPPLHLLRRRDTLRLATLRRDRLRRD